MRPNDFRLIITNGLTWTLGIINTDNVNLKTGGVMNAFFEKHKGAVMGTIIVMLFAIGMTLVYIADMKNEELNDVQKRKQVDMEMLNAPMKGW